MHIDDKWQQFSERMAFEGSLHMAVETFEPTLDTVARLNERNLHVLRTLASLDERRIETGSDEDNPIMQELQRMDSKINVLLDILDRLLMPGMLLPPRQQVKFNAVGLLIAHAAIPSDRHMLVRLHFDACRALPLELPALLGNVAEGANAFIYFCELNEMVEDGLERFVFCHHRRKVAEARLTGSAENVPGSKPRV